VWLEIPLETDKLMVSNIQSSVCVVDAHKSFLTGYYIHSPPFSYMDGETFHPNNIILPTILSESQKPTFSLEEESMEASESILIFCWPLGIESLMKSHMCDYTKRILKAWKSCKLVSERERERERVKVLCADLWDSISNIFFQSLSNFV